jgi:hypothetical protein
MSAKGYARIFDLEPGADTSRLRVSIDESTGFYRYTFFLPSHRFNAKRGMTMSFRTSAERCTTARRPVAVLPHCSASNHVGSGNNPAHWCGSNLFPVTNGAMNNMDAYDWPSTK